MVQSGKTLREVMANARTGEIDSAEATTACKEGAEAKAARAKPAAPSKAKEVRHWLPHPQTSLLVCGGVFLRCPRVSRGHRRAATAS